MRITPACAGKRGKSSEGRGEGEDHPRLRGEKSPKMSRISAKSGSPPLARGKGFCILNPYG